MLNFKIPLLSLGNAGLHREVPDQPHEQSSDDGNADEEEQQGPDSPSLEGYESEVSYSVGTS